MSPKIQWLWWGLRDWAVLWRVPFQDSMRRFPPMFHSYRIGPLEIRIWSDRRAE